jgi:hypothetical protein
LGLLAREAVAGVADLPGAAHHLVTVAGAVAFYLSAPGAERARAVRLTAPVVEELGPLLDSALAIFAVWRGAKRRYERRAHGARPGPERAVGVVPVLG